MKATSGRLSDYQIWATAANRDSAESSVGNCTKESFLVGERNLLEVCAVAVRAASLETKQSCELWVLFMVGPLPDDAGNNRGRQFDGSTSPCAKDSAGFTERRLKFLPGLRDSEAGSKA